MLKDGIYNIEEGVIKLAKLIAPLPLSAEVTTNDLKEMMEQAKWLASLAHNVVIKIPVENEFGAPCLGSSVSLRNPASRSMPPPSCLLDS